MKYCYYCGEQLEDDDKFCINCGKSQDDIDSGTGAKSYEEVPIEESIVVDSSSVSYGYIPEEQDEHNARSFNKKPIIAGIALVVSVCAIMGVAWSLFSGNFANNDEDTTQQEYYDYDEDETPDDYSDDFSNDNSFEDQFYGYDSDFVLPDSHVRYINADEIEHLDEDETQHAINEIYARHGRIFKEEPYASYFSSCEWFYPQYTADEFDDSCFNEYERENVKTLAEHRKEMSVE